MDYNNKGIIENISSDINDMKQKIKRARNHLKKSESKYQSP